ncbi:MAG: copper-binding protein [Ramlibacter sp.]|nr:copper-binding protein [Ramlibacter sp.]
MKLSLSLSLLILPLAALHAHAQTPPAAAKPTAPASARQLPLARGEVLEVDAKLASVTVKHGPIPRLGMDPMTMEFLVPDPKVLAQLKPGARIRFDAVFKDGDYLITRVEVLKSRVSPRAKPSAPQGK